MEREAKLLIEMIGDLLAGRKKEYGDFDMSKLKKTASAHGLLFLLGYIFDDKSLKDVTSKAVYTAENQVEAFEEIKELCENAGIFIVPLKGVCTRERYPDKYLRRMGDIDILYKPEQDKLLRTEMAKHDYEWLGENLKHDHYTKKPCISVEMHREFAVAGYRECCDDVWDKAKTVDGKKYICELPVEDEFILNILHFAGHMKSGGAGIRLIMDVYVYNHIDMDKKYLMSELERIGLTDFYENVSAVAEKWFGGKKDDREIITKLEEFIIESGLFGSHENISAVSVSESRAKYIFNSIFPRYKSMKTAFLWLEKYPFLLPVAWVMRIFIVIFKRRSNLSAMVTNVKKGDRRKGKELKEFFGDIGL